LLPSFSSRRRRVFIIRTQAITSSFLIFSVRTSLACSQPTTLGLLFNAHLLQRYSKHTTLLPGFTAYAASKAAVHNFARGWTMELKDRKIRVNCVSPGAIDTPALATTTGLTAEQAEQAVAQFTSQIPLGRRRLTARVFGAIVTWRRLQLCWVVGCVEQNGRP
jgi:NAD(P)-dependent dehydrogenase (short-subunit alcohol dehydrogenase family)